MKYFGYILPLHFHLYLNCTMFFPNRTVNNIVVKDHILGVVYIKCKVPNHLMRTRMLKQFPKVGKILNLNKFGIVLSPFHNFWKRPLPSS